jgi:uncharacterized protein (DUF111 family)
MKIAYFDPFSGASGDMMLGALVDAGLSVAALSTELSKIAIGGYRITTDRRPARDSRHPALRGGCR